MESDKQHSNKFDWLKAYQWQKGQSGNPNGRPKTKTLKEFARDMLANMSDEDRIEYLKTLPSDFIWKMSEGNPETKTDLTTNGKDLVVPIYAGQSVQVPRHDSDKKDIPTEEEN